MLVLEDGILLFKAVLLIDFAFCDHGVTGEQIAFLIAGPQIPALLSGTLLHGIPFRSHLIEVISHPGLGLLRLDHVV